MTSLNMICLCSFLTSMSEYFWNPGFWSRYAYSQINDLYEPKIKFLSALVVCLLLEIKIGWVLIRFGVNVEMCSNRLSWVSGLGLPSIFALFSCFFWSSTINYLLLSLLLISGIAGLISCACGILSAGGVFGLLTHKVPFCVFLSSVNWGITYLKWWSLLAWSSLSHFHQTIGLFPRLMNLDQICIRFLLILIWAKSIFLPWILMTLCEVFFVVSLFVPDSLELKAFYESVSIIASCCLPILPGLLCSELWLWLRLLKLWACSSW